MDFSLIWDFVSGLLINTKAASLQNAPHVRDVIACQLYTALHKRNTIVTRCSALLCLSIQSSFKLNTEKCHAHIVDPLCDGPVLSATIVLLSAVCMRASQHCIRGFVFHTLYEWRVFMIRAYMSRRDHWETAYVRWLRRANL